MGKYALLGEYLGHQRETRIAMSFEDIERVIGSELPPSALEHRAWWSNNPENNVATREWRQAGYMTEDVDLANRAVVFRRRESARVAESGSENWGRTDVANAAVQERVNIHPLYGRFKGKIHIAPGTDLTQPADPDWGKIWDE